MDDEAGRGTIFDLGVIGDLEDAGRLCSLLESALAVAAANGTTGLVVHCTVDERIGVDMRLIDALARAALAVKHAGGTFVVVNPPTALRGLIHFVGLAACLSVAPIRAEGEVPRRDDI